MMVVDGGCCKLILIRHWNQGVRLRSPCPLLCPPYTLLLLSVGVWWGVLRFFCTVRLAPRLSRIKLSVAHLELPASLYPPSKPPLQCCHLVVYSRRAQGPWNFYRGSFPGMARHVGIILLCPMDRCHLLLL